MYRVILVFLIVVIVGLVFSAIAMNVAEENDPISYEETVRIPLYTLVAHGEKAALRQSGIVPYKDVSWIYGDVAKLPKEFLDGSRPVSVQVTAFASFDVFWNDNLIGSNGVPANNEEDEQPGLVFSAYFIPQRLIRPEGNILSFRYSSQASIWNLEYICNNTLIQTCPNRGFHAVVTGYAPADSFIHPLRRNAQYIQGLLMVGLLGAATIVTAFMFLLNGQDRNSLWVSLTFLSVTALYFSLSVILIPVTYPFFALRSVALAVSLMGFGTFLNLAVCSYLEIKRIPNWGRWLMGIVIPVFLFIFFAIDQYITFAPVVIAYLLFAIMLSAWCAVKGAAYGKILCAILISFLLFSLGGEYLLGVRTFFYGLSALAVMHIVYTILLFQRSKVAAHQAQLLSQRLEMELVKKNLQPHFLMNTLSAMSEWVEVEPATSIKMIDALATEFRILNGMIGKSLVPLSEELALCSAHLAIMSYRQDRRFVLDADIKNWDVVIPPAIIHTLVENALTHTHYDKVSNRFLIKQSETEEGELRYEIISPPGSVSRKGTASVGLGMGTTYINARLREAVGDTYSFEEHEVDEGGWRAIIMIPHVQEQR